MIRRRRRVREIPFSFDSFLDIVANVVGIIIRLILVVWVGARSYSSIRTLATTPPQDAHAKASRVDPSDPLSAQLAQHRKELAEAQERLLAQLRQMQGIQNDATQAEQQLSGLLPVRQRLQDEESRLNGTGGERARAASVIALTSAELRQRTVKLAEEIRAVEQAPAPKKALHYRTPISRPLQSEELLFECNHGRVTFIDIAALLNEVRQGMDDKVKQLRNQWQVSDVTSTVGAFRLRYTIERERDLLDAVASGAVPDSHGNFRAGLSEWVVEPRALDRGESLDRALKGNSEFRQIVDGIEPHETAVTFWVYPDSFEIFRRLRDLLYERDVTVAGRPLPDGVPIASSRRGSVSRGQ
jgi:hypothetical protein